MKKTIHILLYITYSFIFGNTNGLCQNLHPFILRGNIKGKKTGYIYLNYIPAGGNGVMDSCDLHNGHFEIKGYISEPTQANFSTFGFSGTFDEGNLTEFYIEPTLMTAYATFNHFNELKLKGSASEDSRSWLVNSRLRDSRSRKSVEDSLQEYERHLMQIKKDDPNSSLIKKLSFQIDSNQNIITLLSNKMVLDDSVYIANNPDSYVAADMLSHETNAWISYTSFKSLYSHFSRRIRESIPGKQIAYDIQKEDSIFIGSEAKNFIAIDNNGHKLTLADFKGKKYILLDFGASWCAPCRKLVHYLKEDYNKYKSEVEIISISLRDKEEDWLGAIKKDSVQWPQVLDKSLSPPMTNLHISDSYYIDQIPSFILIDKNFKIIGKYGNFYSSKRAYVFDLNETLKNLFDK
jgi:thiol-disulfide isomerase/thioredoxin